VEALAFGPVALSMVEKLTVSLRGKTDEQILADADSI
jgi:hypothetical protein